MCVCVCTLALTGANAPLWASAPCPADCNSDGAVSLEELSLAREDVLMPSSTGAPTRCSATDSDGDGSFGVEDLIRGANARGVGCRNIVLPAGLRGSVFRRSDGLLVSNANVRLYRLPPGDSVWAWPGAGTNQPTPTPLLQFHVSALPDTTLRPGLPPPNFAFDPPAAACLANVFPTPAPSPGLIRLDVRHSGHEPRILYRWLSFAKRELSYSSASCTTGTSRPVADVELPLWPTGSSPAHDLLPDFVVHERHMQSDWSVECADMPAGMRDLRVLRVGLSTPNVGQGDLRVEGFNLNNCEAADDVVEQVIAQSDGGTPRRLPLPAGSMAHHPAHAHVHFSDWAHLRVVAPTPGLCDRLAERPSTCILRQSNKLSFCLLDYRLFDGELESGRRYRRCGQIQGISTGWTDVYESGLFGQFIDVDTLPRGSYWIEAEANVGGLLAEETTDNNVGRVRLSLGAAQECTRLATDEWVCRAPTPTPPPAPTPSPTTGPGTCWNVDCRNVAPDCCPASCDDNDCSRLCRRCKDYFCLLDPNSVACLGGCHTCPPNVVCNPGHPVTPCPRLTFTPTSTATATPRTPVPTRTPTSTPPTPRLPMLAVLIPDIPGQPGESVPLEFVLAGGQNRVGGLQWDLLVPANAVAAPDPASCTVHPSLSATHRVFASLPADHSLPGFHRLRVMVADHNLTEPSYDPTQSIGDGTVATCSLAILSNAARGNYPLRIERARAGDERGTELWPLPGRSTLRVGGCSGSCC